ncbi:kynureninase [Psychrobacter aquimaris]|uniref:kynureninase n=1 Tax=Psychrobacter aquimaris TaxID=292733 RepID=UPI003FD09A43
MNGKLMLIVISILPILACSNDPNSEPKYGDSGLPSNCRSYIQVSVDAWRAGEYDAEETMNAIERNCGMYGSLWDE